MGCDQPDAVDAAFDRGEPLVGVAVIALALNHADASAILPRVTRTLHSGDAELSRQGLVALGHVAQLHGTVDTPSQEALRELLNDHDRWIAGAAAATAGDLWMFAPHRDLPGWLRRRERANEIWWRLRSTISWWLMYRWR